MNSHKKKKINLLLIAVLCISAVVLLSGQGRLRRSGGYAEVEGLEITRGEYSDGVYQGEADGFRPGLQVEIEITRGELNRIEVIAHNEIGRQFWEPPIRLIPEEIIKRQNTEVDTVSGATATSYGIMAAVEDALEEAKGN